MVSELHSGVEMNFLTKQYGIQSTEYRYNYYYMYLFSL